MGSRSVAIGLSAEPRSAKSTLVNNALRRPGTRSGGAGQVITMRGIGDHDPWNG
jgi:hypothetical protein